MMEIINDWKQIKGFDNYEVNSQGLVRNKSSERILKNFKNVSVSYQCKNPELRVGVRKDNLQYKLYIKKLVREHFN